MPSKGQSSNRNNQTTRQTSAPATGPAPDTSGPTGTVPLANVSNADDLKAIEALTGTAGLLAKTAANTWALRTLTGSSSLQVTNGDGVSGNPTLEVGLLDTNSSHRLRLAAGSDLTADRILTLTTGDLARTITLTGDPTVADWFDQSVKTTAQVQHLRLGIGVAASSTASEPLVAQTEASTPAFYRIRNYGGASNILGMPALRFDRARGSLASPTQLLVGDQMGRFSFFGYASDASAFVETIQFAGRTLEEYNASTARGSELVVRTRAPGSSAAVADCVRFRITGPGSSIIGAREHTAVPAAVLAQGEFELSTYDDASSPQPASLVWRYNDAGTELSSRLYPSGTYTPTLTNVANLGASTAYQCQYVRVGNFVTVSGKVDVDPTLTVTLTQLGISLPIASNLGAAEDCAGVAFASGIAGQGAAILGDAANNRAEMNWIAGDVTNQPMYFVFSYEVI